MSEFNYTATNLKKHVAADVNGMNITFERWEDYKDHLENEIESNGYCTEPSVDYIYDAWSIVGSDLWRNTDFKKPDFSYCQNAFDCVLEEARTCIYSATYEAKQEVISSIADALDEIFNHDFGDKEVLEMMIGQAGMGHIPHNEEIDIADSSLIVWNSRIQITVEGVTLYGVLSNIE